DRPEFFFAECESVGTDAHPRRSPIVRASSLASSSRSRPSSTMYSNCHHASSRAKLFLPRGLLQRLQFGSSAGTYSRQGPDDYPASRSCSLLHRLEASEFRLSRTISSLLRISTTCETTLRIRPRSLAFPPLYPSTG